MKISVAIWLAVAFLISASVTPLGRRNTAMVMLAKCLVPISWTSYAERPGGGRSRRGAVPDGHCLSAAERLNPANTELAARVEIIRGDRARQRGDAFDAIAHYRAAIASLGKPAPEISAVIAYEYQYDLHRPDIAANVLIKALAASPGAESLRTRAAELFLFHIKPSDPRRAVELMQPQVDDFHSAYAYYLAATAYSSLRRYQQSAIFAKKAIALAKSEKNRRVLRDAVYVLGIAQRCGGDEAGGLRTLATAQVLDPTAHDAATAMSSDRRTLCGENGNI